MVVIQDVWADNFEKEMERIRILVERFPYVAMVSIFYLGWVYHDQCLR